VSSAIVCERTLLKIRERVVPNEIVALVLTQGIR
jgi:hypothetical protein